MKKNSAVVGTLAAAGSLIANLAMADTSTTSVAATAPKLIDKITASYYGAYSGPSITNPTRHTTDVDARGALADDSFQNLDSTLSAGYKLAPNVTLAGNYRFIYSPMTADGQDWTTKDPWLSLRHGKLVNTGGFNLAADLRLYIPVQTAGRMNTAIRSTQTATYEIPNTRLTLGTFTFLRANSIRDVRADQSKVMTAQAYLSVFANYQITPKLAATAWSDLIQLDYSAGQELSNKIVPIQLGVNWDVTPSLSLNPTFNFFPATATLERTTLGLIVSARFL